MPKKQEGEKLLTVMETAERLGISTATVRRWADDGILKAHRLPKSGFRRFPEGEVERVRRGIESGESEPTPRATP